MKAGEAGFQSTRDQKVRNRRSAEKDIVGFFFFKQKERQISFLIAV